VMAHESFENPEIAAVLNDGFVPVKVDREERPDVDRVYMSFVQATTGSGGWPMSVWLTPGLKPFFGGTYFPPASRWGRPGFVDVLQEISRAWSADRARIEESADAIVDRLRSLDERHTATAGVPGAEALARSVGQFRAAFDERHGGFGQQPKFPRPSELLFLLREHARTSREGAADGAALDMVLRTLRGMADGGMRDHVGGGFHRYSVDGAWRVPHFEKMLYDQAQLVLAFVEASQASGDSFYLDVAEDTLLYVLREMTDPAGGFYCAEDADSVPPERAGEPGAHASEGAFYLWRADELTDLLGEDAPVVARRFGVEPDGNAPFDPQHEFTGRNLLYVAESVDEIAARSGKSAGEVVEVLRRSRLVMFERRLTRPRPGRDDKVLTAWNGLMIAALARAARAGGRGPYLEAARRAARFLRETMWQADTRRLLRRWRGGEASIDAYAEDYAGLVFGLIELFQADADPGWLEWALTLQRRQDELFWDEQGGAWFSTTGADPTVLLRTKEDYDGAEPSASSLSVMNLLALSHLVDEPAWTERIERTFKALGEHLERAGRGVPMLLAALSTRIAGLQQIVVVSGSRDGREMEEALAHEYLPFSIQVHVTAENRPRLAGSLPFVATMRALDERTSVYVCRNYTCLAPATNLRELERALAS
jgi:uncharacterized protein YyaL (SSP411 family)